MTSSVKCAGHFVVASATTTSLATQGAFGKAGGCLPALLNYVWSICSSVSLCCPIVVCK